MKCVRCVYCFWQIHNNGLSYCEQQIVLMIHLKRMGNWSWGSTQIELVGAPLFFMYFHSQPVLIHSSGLSLQFKFFYSFGNQGILVLTNYHELRPFKRDYHLIQFHLTCDVYAIRFTESPSFDVLWHLITVT